MTDNIPESAKTYPGAPWDEKETDQSHEFCDYCENPAEYERFVGVRKRILREKMCMDCLQDTFEEEGTMYKEDQMPEWLEGGFVKL